MQSIPRHSLVKIRPDLQAGRAMGLDCLHGTSHQSTYYD